MKANPTAPLLRAALAAVLACGLMLPTSALAVDGRESETPRTSVADPAAALLAAAPDEALAAPLSSTPFIVTGGRAGASAGDGDYYYDASAGTLHVQTSTPLTISTAGQVSENIEIDAGVKADLTLRNVDILTPSGANKSPINMVTNVRDTADGSRATRGNDIQNKTMLHLTLADGSTNRLNCGNKTHGSSGSPAIRCGWGSVLVIDDSVRNLDENNNIVTPKDGKVGADVTLSNGTKLAAGDPLSKMDAANPGTLYATGGSHSAGIGSGPQENSGTLIFNGGNLIVAASEIGENGSGDNSASSGAAIGSGDGGSGTTTIINGGRIDAQASYHGAGIGCGWGWKHWYDLAKDDAIAIPATDQGYGYYSSAANRYYNVAGDIYINGGFIRAKGAAHGNAFGMGCHGTETSNRGHIIRITGGTLLPSSAGDRKDIGGLDGYTIVTGGSVNCPASKFQGLGNTAYNTPGIENWDDVTALGGSLPDGDKVQMITIDLSAEIIKTDPDTGAVVNDGNNIIESWKLYVKGQEKSYGAPYQFDSGKLYLWLPTSDIDETISVELSYRDNNGKVQKVDPLFREPGAGSVLKSYIDFELPDEYLDKLTKPYDGKPFDPYDIAAHPITTEEDIPKTLDKPGKVSYTYQLYDKREGSALGPEIASKNEMPTDVGVMKFIMTSKQFSNPDPEDDIDPKFEERYWGHRATGWCEITPVPSKVNLLNAEWVISGKPGDDPHDSRQELRVQADIASGTFDDGTPTAGTCKAPQGRVQLFVDGKAVGDPIDILFADRTDEGGTVHKANATAVDNGRGGSYTHFSYVFTPAEADYLVPDATTDNKHIISIHYLPPEDGASTPANYLESANPAKQPEAAPKVPVAIDPVDPNPTVTGEPDPDNTDPDAPEPSVTTGTPTPTDPGADPGKPGHKTYRGTIVTSWDVPSEANPHPGRVLLKVKTPSTGPISVTNADGELYEADFLRDGTGSPVRNADGSYTLVLDPERVGTGALTFKQEPNGAYTGTTWVYDVTVKPNPKIPPKTSVAKKAENLTHPGGPTQPGDRIRYTVTARNDAAGSAWNGVEITDRLPACLELDEGTVRLANPSVHFDNALTTATSSGPATLGEYAQSAPDADGRRTLVAPAGAIYGVGAAVLTFECIVSPDASGPDASADLENIAEATGTRPDPDDPSKDLPEKPHPSDPALPQGPRTVVPADPEVKLSKSVENTSALGAKVTHVGDALRYRVELSNNGPANSCLVDAVVSDPLPVGMEPVPRSISMELPDGSSIAVDDAAYDRASRTIAVTAGDLWGDQKVVLIFEVIVTEEALGASNANVAAVHGTVPSEGPDPVPTNPDPGKPTAPPSGDPEATTSSVEPPILVGDDPGEGDISIKKEAENTTSDDGQTRVGDTVRYEVVLRNDGAATSWMDAVIRDDVPEGLEPVSGSIKMTLPDGRDISVDDAAYNHETRRLSVAAGHLYGGQSVTLVFDALVTEAAVGADIGNVAEALGMPPSRWDPDSEHPEPGQPFDPPGGWEPFDRANDKVASPATYPPGTDEKGGVLPGEADDAKTIKKVRLAQTGDVLVGAFALLPVLALLAAGATLIALRRLRRGGC